MTVTPPSHGTALRLEDLTTILEVIETRKNSFPEEPFDVTLGVVLFNLGDMFAKVDCVGGEWHASKMDFPPGHGVPKCPNGHVCVQGPGMRLGWLNG